MGKAHCFRLAVGLVVFANALLDYADVVLVDVPLRWAECLPGGSSQPKPRA